LAQVYAGLAYYHANREQLEAAIEADHMEAERLEQEPMGGRRLAA